MGFRIIFRSTLLIKAKIVPLSCKQLELYVLIYPLPHIRNPSWWKITSRKHLENTTVLFWLFSHCLKDHWAAGGHATCLMYGSHCLLHESPKGRGGAPGINRQRSILKTEIRMKNWDLLFSPLHFTSKDKFYVWFSSERLSNARWTIKMQLFLTAIVGTQKYVPSFVLKNVLVMLHWQNEVLLAVKVQTK